MDIKNINTISSCNYYICKDNCITYNADSKSKKLCCLDDIAAKENINLSEVMQIVEKCNIPVYFKVVVDNTEKIKAYIDKQNKNQLIHTLKH